MTVTIVGGSFDVDNRIPPSEIMDEHWDLTLGDMVQSAVSTSVKKSFYLLRTSSPS